MAKKEDTVYEQLKGKVEDLSAKLKDLEGQTEDYIAEHPLKSTAVVFGAGVIIGAVVAKLLSRK